MFNKHSAFCIFIPVLQQILSPTYVKLKEIAETRPTADIWMSKVNSHMLFLATSMTPAENAGRGRPSLWHRDGRFALNLTLSRILCGVMLWAFARRLEERQPMCSLAGTWGQFISALSSPVFLFSSLGQVCCWTGKLHSWTRTLADNIINDFLNLHCMYFLHTLRYVLAQPWKCAKAACGRFT